MPHQAMPGQPVLTTQSRRVTMEEREDRGAGAGVQEPQAAESSLRPAGKANARFAPDKLRERKWPGPQCWAESWGQRGRGSARICGVL